MGEPHRILVLSPWGLHGGYSGPLVLLDRLMGAAVATGRVEVDVAYRDRGNEQIPAWVNTGHVVCSGALGRPQQVSWVLGIRRLLRRMDGRYDFIHLHGCYATNLIPLVAHRGAPALIALPVLEKGDLRKRGGLAGTATAVARRPLSNAAVALALSQGIAADLRHAGVPTRSIGSLPNPADAAAFAEPSTPAAPQQGTIRLGFVGKLGALKRPQLVVEAVNVLRNGGVEASAVFVGPFQDQATESTLRRLVASLALADHVEFAGFQSDVDRFLKKSIDVLVLPSVAEGMPGSLAEAMSRGVPAIVTDVGAMGNVIREAQGGLVLDSASGETIAAAARRITDDSAFFSEVSRNALDYAAEKFSPAAAAQVYVQALDAASK